MFGAGVLYLIASGKAGWMPNGFASNGYGDLSPGKYGLLSCFLVEVLATFFFLFIIIGTTSKGAATGFAGIPIGFALVLIHLISIPITNTSVNPARSTGPALFAGAEAMGQLWLFWLAPVLGAVMAGAMARWLYEPGHDHRDDDRREADSGVGIDGTHSVSRPHLRTDEASMTRGVPEASTLGVPRRPPSRRSLRCDT